MSYDPVSVSNTDRRDNWTPIAPPRGKGCATSAIPSRAQCHLNEVFADLRERPVASAPHPGRQTRTQQLVHHYPALLKIILETSPPSRASHPVRPSSASGASERHPAFAELAPWPEAFRIAPLPFCAFPVFEPGCPRLEPGARLPGYQYGPPRFPKRKRPRACPRGLRLRLLHHSRPLAKPRRVK
jgi:hypothetical protein